MDLDLPRARVMNQLVPLRSSTMPELVAAAGERAGMRFLEFFAANIRNPHTRRAYARAVDEFLGWCSSAGVPWIGAVQPVHSPPGSRPARASSRRRASATARRDSPPVRLARHRPGRANTS